MWTARRRIGRGCVLVGAAALSALATWSPAVAASVIEVSRADYEGRGLDWPLTIDAAELGCDRLAVFVEAPDGSRHGLNGAGIRRYQPLEPIWAVDEAIMAELAAAGLAGGPPIRINVGDMIAEGLTLCDR